MGPKPESNPVRTDIEEIQEVVKEFLSKYQYLYEYRVQKLVFYAEVYCIDNYENRITDAHWKPYIYGSFSEDVRMALRKLDVPKQSVYIEGSDTTKYLNSIDESHLHADKKKIIRRVHELTRNMSTDELAKFSKSHWLFIETNYESDMDFSDYKNHILEVDESDRPLYDDDRPELSGVAQDVLVPV